MTFVQPADKLPVPHEARHRVPAGESGVGRFADILDDRLALTDPRVDPSANRNGAPMAVAFSRGDLFGQAVPLAHEPALPASRPLNDGVGDWPEPDAPQVPAAGESAEPPTGHDVLAASGAGQAATSEGQAAEPQKTPFQPERDRPAGQLAPGLSAAQGNGATMTRALSRTPPKSAAVRHPHARTERGAALRWEAVMQFSLVNAVVRATPAGLAVAARIGGSSPIDDVELEDTIRRAVENEGETLSGLIVNGQAIEGSK